jgi:HEAT repeat protein
MTPREYAQELLASLRSCLAEEPTASSHHEHLAACLERIPVRLLASVDATLRESFSMYSPDGWPQLGPREVASFVWGQRTWVLLAVAASHRSGYVRQAAVRGLAASADGRALPYVILRLNDWVSDVQAAARTALEALLRPEFAAHLVSAQPLLWALERQRRASHADLVRRVFTLLRSESFQPAVRAGCLSPDRDLRRACYEILLQSEGVERAPLLRDALTDREPAIRYWAIRQVAKAFPEPWTEPLTARALIDRSVQVRRVALTTLAPRLSPEHARRLIEAALVDVNTTARWQARVLILQQGPCDLADFYRRALTTASSPARLRGALLGLGESGTRDDLSLVSSYLGAERLSVRCAAIRALADLEPLMTTAPFLEAMVAPQPSVSREGRRALEPRLSHLPAATIGTMIIGQHFEAHVRRNALSLANELSKWEALPLLLDGCADSNKMAAKMALLLVDAWLRRYNRSFLQPTRAQLDRAAESLARIPVPVKRSISPHIAQILESLRR